MCNRGSFAETLYLAYAFSPTFTRVCAVARGKPGAADDIASRTTKSVANAKESSARPSGYESKYRPKAAPLLCAGVERVPLGLLGALLASARRGPV